MDVEFFVYLITHRLADGSDACAIKRQQAHSAWSAGAQFLRDNPGAKIVSIQRLQQ